MSCFIKEIKKLNKETFEKTSIHDTVFVETEWLTVTCDSELMNYLTVVAMNQNDTRNKNIDISSFLKFKTNFGQ